MRSTAGKSAHSAAEVLHLDEAAHACSMSSRTLPGISNIVDSSGCCRGTIEFETGVPSTGRSEFTADFARDLTRIEQWIAGQVQGWILPPIRPFRVVVSERFKISRSLVPAWSGLPGHMEFPAWRAAARKAAITHELAHIYFPNGNRLLAEGFAIYLQALLGGNPAFPNFGRPLHDVAVERLRTMVPAPASLDKVRLTDLDAIATPGPLTLRIGDSVYGEEPRGQLHLYGIAGSFVQHLIEVRGLATFRELYEYTPMLPLRQNSGSPQRWSEAYGVSLSQLESEWKLSLVCQH